MIKNFETELAGRKLVIETGKIAELANRECSGKVWRYLCDGKCNSL